MSERKDIFISYKSEEFDEANWVRTTLENNGISCWMAPMSIPGGSNYAVEIPQAIRNCRVFVLILSENSQNSTWVPKEVDQAINEGKIVMPFMLENCSLKDDFNFYLTNVQRYAAYENKSRAIEKMLREIKAILGITDEPAKEEPAPAEPKPIVTPKPPKAPKPSKVSKTRKPKPSAASNSDTKKKLPIILGAAAGAIVLIIALFFIIDAATHVTIAGQKYEVGRSYLALENKTLTVSDMESIGKMDELYSLSLTGCTLPASGISDALDPELANLTLSDCGLNDHLMKEIGFDRFTKLYVLDISNNPDITSLGEIACLSDKITDLNVSGLDTEDLTDTVSGFLKLTDLKMNEIGDGLESLEFLSEHENITYLEVRDNRLTDLRGIERCLSLEELYVTDNGLETLDGLENTSKLCKVSIEGNSIDNIHVFARSAAYLNELYMSRNDVADLTPLADADDLRVLYANANKITDVSPLAGKPLLYKLSLADNAITSVEALSDLTKLSHLNLAGNKLASTSGLDLIPYEDGKTVILDLSDNPIVELKLNTACNYSYLGLCGIETAVPDALYSAKGYHLTFDHSDSIDYAKLAGAGYSDLMIFGCPLDRQLEVSETLGKYKTAFMETDDYRDILDKYW